MLQYTDGGLQEWEASLGKQNRLQQKPNLLGAVLDVVALGLRNQVHCKKSLGGSCICLSPCLLLHARSGYGPHRVPSRNPNQTFFPRGKLLVILVGPTYTNVTAMQGSCTCSSPGTDRLRGRTASSQPVWRDALQLQRNWCSHSAYTASPYRLLSCFMVTHAYASLNNASPWSVKKGCYVSPLVVQRRRKVCCSDARRPSQLTLRERRNLRALSTPFGRGGVFLHGR